MQYTASVLTVVAGLAWRRQRVVIIASELNPQYFGDLLMPLCIIDQVISKVQYISKYCISTVQVCVV